MLIVPSISVIKGRTIRLQQGDYTKEKVYEESPIEVASQFEDHGITRIHLIDLEGAKRGKVVNYDSLQLITGYTNLKVNFAGGVHTDGDIIKSFEHRAESVTAASAAVQDRETFANWIMSYGREKIALAADSLNGIIRIKGWQMETSIKLFDHVAYFYDRGLKYLKTTDISKDGVLDGPSFELYKALLKEFPNLCIFASGGIRNIDDIKKLSDQGLYGAIFGKAFYEGRITLTEIEQFVSVYA
ncbi:MAG: 1-(5-phosphoribosyl)-5-[(5-phosphoribosylamino)methylideneamino] imidazole-4-carboxamide isomerase [Bacteroidota bacterium]